MAFHQLGALSYDGWKAEVPKRVMSARNLLSLIKTSEALVEKKKEEEEEE